MLSPTLPTLKHLCPALFPGSQVHRDHTDYFLNGQKLPGLELVSAASQGHGELFLCLHLLFLLSLPTLIPSESQSLALPRSPVLATGSPVFFWGQAGHMTQFSHFVLA